MFLDGDYADPPMELAQVIRPVLADEADLVLGCRAWTLVTCAASYAHWTPPSVRTAEAV